jgi:hypothetical protein
MLGLPPRLEHGFVGVGAAHDLDGREALGPAVGGKFLKTLPGHPLAEIFPPGVGQPEERRAVGVFEMSVIVGDADRPVPEERIVIAAGNDVDRAFDAVESWVASVRALERPGVRASHVGGVADDPGVAAGPEGRHMQAGAVGRGDDRVEFKINEGIFVRLVRDDPDLRDAVRLDLKDLASERHVRQGDRDDGCGDDGEERNRHHGLSLTRCLPGQFGSRRVAASNCGPHRSRDWAS